MSERRSATTIGELDLHLSYVQAALTELQQSVAAMATRADFEQLAARMDGLATKAELKALEDKLAGDSVPGTFSRLSDVAGRALVIGTVVAAIIGGAVTLLRYLDKASSVIEAQPAGKAVK